MGSTEYPNTGQYSQQGGNVKVIASGGTLKFESGGKTEIESGGEFEVQSGGFFDLQGGALLNLVSSSNQITASQARALLWNPTQFSIIQESTGAGSGVLSVINLPSAGFIIISCSTACSNASAWMTSMTGIPGQRMIIMHRGVGNAASIFISMSGVSVVGTLSGDLSSFTLHQSATAVSQAYIEMVCTGSTEWSIIDQRGSVVQQGSS
jgi:hypothetical protein